MPTKRNDPNNPLKVLLEAKELKKTFNIFKNFWFETKVAVDGVTLRVHEGEIVGILGPNGAGKSTSLKMISGDLVPNSGAVYFDGLDVTEWPMYKRCNNGLGYMAQDNTLFKQMSVENNLFGVMQMQGFPKKEARERCEELLEIFDLSRLRNNIAARLSGGEKRRLEVARALTKRPKMLILDEPFAGVDPKVIQTVRKLVVELSHKWGIAILITDHSVPNIVQLVEWCYVIDGGKVIFEGPPEELINNSAVRESYLGDGGLGQATTIDKDGKLLVNHKDFDVFTSQIRSASTQIESNNEPYQDTNFHSSEIQQNVESDINYVTNCQTIQNDNINSDLYNNYDSEITPSSQPLDSEYSESDFTDNYQAEGKSEKLSSFIPQANIERESYIENDNLKTEQSEQMNNQSYPQNENPIPPEPIQPKRKTPPASPVIKPFRRKS